jgi:hypothetical protein
MWAKMMKIIRKTNNKKNLLTNNTMYGKLYNSENQFLEVAI